MEQANLVLSMTIASSCTGRMDQNQLCRLGREEWRSTNTTTGSTSYYIAVVVVVVVVVVIFALVAVVFLFGPAGDSSCLGRACSNDPGIEPANKGK